MSYDLMVFDAAVAPRERPAFIEWFEEHAEDSEEHSYDPAITTAELRAWYEEIRKTFPNMNGPGAPPLEQIMSGALGDQLGDYSIGRHGIYACFPWPVAEQAYPLVRSLAVKHGLGFYDVSGDDGDGEIHFPGEDLKPESQGAWRQIAREIKEMGKQ